MQSTHCRDAHQLPNDPLVLNHCSGLTIIKEFLIESFLGREVFARCAISPFHPPHQHSCPHTFLLESLLCRYTSIHYTYNHPGITAWKPSAAWDLEVVARSAICSGLTTSPDPISQQVPTTEHLQRYFSNNPYSLSSQLVNHMGIPKSYLKR